MVNKFSAFHDDSGCNHAAMIIAGYLQKEHPVEPKAVLAMVNQIQEWVKISFQVSAQAKKAGIFEKLLDFSGKHSIVTHGSVSLSCATSPHPSCFSKS